MPGTTDGPLAQRVDHRTRISGNNQLKMKALHTHPNLFDIPVFQHDHMLLDKRPIQIGHWNDRKPFACKGQHMIFHQAHRASQPVTVGSHTRSNGADHRMTSTKAQPMISKSAPNDSFIHRKPPRLLPQAHLALKVYNSVAPHLEHIVKLHARRAPG